VEQPFEPADQLRLRDPQFGVRRDTVLTERQRQPLELLAQFGRQPVLEFANACAVVSPAIPPPITTISVSLLLLRGSASDLLRSQKF